MCVHVTLCACMCVHNYVYVCVRACGIVCMYVCAHVALCVCMCVHMWHCVCVCVCACGIVYYYSQASQQLEDIIWLKHTVISPEEGQVHPAETLASLLFCYYSGTCLVYNGPKGHSANWLQEVAWRGDMTNQVAGSTEVILVANYLFALLAEHGTSQVITATKH